MTTSNEKIQYDLALVGASPANLSMVYTFLDKAKANPSKKYSIAILEKAEDFGGHIVSGAVVKKEIFDQVFPNHLEDKMPIEAVCDKSFFSIMGKDKKWDVPSVITRAAAPDFCKEGYYVLSLSLVVGWMAEQVQAKAAEITNVKLDMFPGFPVNEVLFEGDKVVGVKVDRTGNEIDDNLYAKVTCFADKGFVSKDIINKFELRDNPQIWSVGVKETWKLRAGAPSLQGKVWHTLGYPTLDGSLGGGFVYGLNHNRVTIGLVISLDSENPNIHPQKQLQEYKKHPWFQEMLEGAELLNYGAAVLPEGGLASLPKEFQVDGALLLGDALGLLDMKSLAGVDKAMESGRIAAQVVIEALEKDDFSKESLKPYQSQLMASPWLDKLKANRYFRKAFLDNPQLLVDYLPDLIEGIDKHGNPIIGGLSVGLKDPVNASAAFLRTAQLINAAPDLKEEIKYTEGYTHINPDFSKELIARNSSNTDKVAKGTVYSREDAVFYANTKYNEHPEHIDEFSANTCLTCINKYEAKDLDVPCVSDCTAEVHRLDIREDGIKAHGMSLENCVQCRTCELICPEQNLRVNAAYAGSGPDFRGL